MHEFELGPIRPPSEAYSILLRVTRNCPWNRCAFCMSYRGEKFSLRTVEEVKQDIDSIHFIASRLLEKAQNSGRGIIDENSIYSLSTEEDIPVDYISQVAFWIHFGMKSLFFQDGDTLVMKADRVVEILEYIKQKFPSVQRITTYARSKTLSKKKPEDLKKIREAGLDRLHSGFESGSARVLELIKKGVTPEEHILAGRKAVEAGFELSDFFMPGAGGVDLSDENAIESASVLSEINPSFIRIRTSTPIPGTDLWDMIQRGEWTPVSEEGKVLEIRKLVENLHGIESRIVSDHMMNLLEDVGGKLPEDRDRMLALIDRFLEMEKDDRESFIVGRRIGHFRYLSDYRQSREIDELKNRLKQKYSSLERAALELMGNHL